MTPDDQALIATTPEARAAPPGGWAGLSANARGIAWMLVAALGFGLVGALVKMLGQGWGGQPPLDSLQIAFFRALVALAAVLPFIARAGWSVAVPLYPLRHLGRGATGLAALVCGFYAFTHLPLATATSISFAQPLFMVVLAVLLLHERVRWRRWTATLVGFAGVLVMLRPGAEAVHPAALAALANALFVALSAVQVKAMPDAERDLTLLFSFAAISSAGLLVPALLVWQAPTALQLGLLVAMGLLAAASQAAVIRSYRVGADATLVAPFDYIRLLVAAVLGFSLFGEVPDAWTGVGAAVIVLSTLYIARREAVLGRGPKIPTVR
ncbi:MAG TPA: DMT family transporter [Azospirillaceae bacterium]|nr:DMT family transporter [Azospirillaceae bacterium]